MFARCITRSFDFFLQFLSFSHLHAGFVCGMTHAADEATLTLINTRTVHTDVSQNIVTQTHIHTRTHWLSKQRTNKYKKISVEVRTGVLVCR